MRITSRQLRQIIKEELRRVVKETPEYEPRDTRMKVPGGSIGYSTSVLQDGPYTWEIAISPNWSAMKPQLVADMTKFGTDRQLMYTGQQVIDSFQINLISAAPGARLPGGLNPDDLPFSLWEDLTYDEISDYIFADHDKVLENLARSARAQGKSNLADNIVLVKDYLNHDMDV